MNVSASETSGRLPPLISCASRTYLSESLMARKSGLDGWSGTTTTSASKAMQWDASPPLPGVSATTMSFSLVSCIFALRMASTSVATITGSLGSAIPSHFADVRWSSVSIKATPSPWSNSQIAKWQANVDLDTPPFWLQNAINMNREYAVAARSDKILFAGWPISCCRGG